MPQTNKKTILFGYGNKGATTPLQQGVVVDPLPNITSGMNAMKIEGYNGKGEMKEYGANPFADASVVPHITGFGNAIVVAKHSLNAKKFVLKNPVEPNTSYHIIFDMRSKNKPLAIFEKKFEKQEDGSFEKKEKKLNDTELVIIPKGDFTAKDVSVIAMALAKSLSSIDAESKRKIVSELNANGLISDAKLNLGNVSSMFNFIKIFDDNLLKVEGNIKVLKTELMVEADIAVPKGGLEKLSEIYNPMTLNGIKIGTYAEAMIIKALVNNEIDVNTMDMTEKAFVAYNEEAKISMLELVEADVTFGVDASNNIVMIEDSNVPYQSGGAIHEMAVANLVSEANKAHNAINGAFWEKANSIDPEKYPRNSDTKNYSDNEIIQAEKILMEQAEKYVEYLSNDAQKHLETILSSHEPMITLLGSGDIEKAKEAQKLAQQLTAVTRNGIIQKLIQEDPELLVRDGYFKDGRQIGQANSSPKTLMKYDYKAGERMIVVATDIPKLIKTVGDDAVVNFKSTKMPFMQIVVNKEGAVKDLQLVNTHGAWAKQQVVGRILNSINNLDANDEKLEQKLKNLINYGGKIDGNDTHYGLGAVLQDDNNQLAQFYKPFLSELRTLAYPDGKETFTAETLKAIQEKIENLVNDEDYSLQNLGKQVVALKGREETMQGLFNKAGINTLRGRSEDKADKRAHLKSMLIAILNGEKAEPVIGTELSIANTGAVLKEYIKEVRKGGDKDIMKISSKMGFEHDDAKVGNVIKTTKDGKPYIKTGFYDEHIFGGKEIEEITKAVQQVSSPIDVEVVKAEMKENKAYFDANKKVFERKTLYGNDDEVTTAIEIDIDDPELQEALSEAVKQSNEEVSTEAGEVLAQSEEDAIAEAQEVAEEQDAGMAESLEIEINLDGVDPTMFEDGFDAEESASQDEAKATEMAQAISVSI